MRFTFINWSAASDMDKILARAQSQNISEAPRHPSNQYSGVIPMELRGRFDNERARLGPDFTPADREWRIRWIQSQTLHPNEPYTVPGADRMNLNIFRRIYRLPLDAFEDLLAHKMDRPVAVVARKIVGRAIIGYGLVLVCWYRLNYGLASWEVNKGMRVHHAREVVLPGDPRYPMANPRTQSWQHYDRNFHDRNVFLD